MESLPLVSFRTKFDKHAGASLDMFSLDAVQAGLGDLSGPLPNLSPTTDIIQKTDWKDHYKL